jgi:hypothetical protein
MLEVGQRAKLPRLLDLDGTPPVTRRRRYGKHSANVALCEKTRLDELLAEAA